MDVIRPSCNALFAKASTPADYKADMSRAWGVIQPNSKALQRAQGKVRMMQNGSACQLYCRGDCIIRANTDLVHRG